MVNQIVLVGRIAKAPETRTTETGIGSRLICRCNVCGAEKDITEYSCW